MIIGLSGYARAGKDTVGAVLVNEYGFERVAVSDLLMDMALTIDPWIATYYNDGPHKRGPNFVGLRMVVATEGREQAKRYDDTRELLQKLGDAVKQAFGDDIIVKATMAKLDPGKNYVFTSVRFPAEADAIEAAGGSIWRINRPGTGPVNDHWSETAMDEWLEDHAHFVFDNNHSISHLVDRVRNHLA